ncbi:hypothetical protein BKI52_03060 [marine bacterium AO1-C]|nr:hypothetical protein BKI52_03060 [marine bacterium AO1-C]
MLIFLLVTPNIAQQQTKKDSLLLLLKTLPDDTNRVNVLNELGIMSENGDIKAALQYDQTALTLAQKLKYKKGVDEAKFSIGHVFYAMGNLSRSIKHFKQVLNEAEQDKDSTNIALYHWKLGIIYREKGSFAPSLKHFFGALKIYEARKQKVKQANTLGSLGIVYKAQKRFDKAIEFQRKALAIHEAFGKKYSVAIDYNNLAEVYEHMKQYDKALHYHEKSRKIKEHMGNQRGLSISLVNIASVYNALDNYPKAIEYCVASLKIKEKLGMLKDEVFYNFSRAYFGLKDYKQAIEYGLKSLKISEISGSKYLTKQLTKLLSEIYQQAGDFENALKYYQSYKVYGDSIFNEKKSRQIAEVEAKYQNEKQAQENQFLKKEAAKNEVLLTQRNNLIVAISGGVLLLVVLALVLHRSNLRKQYTNKLLHTQKQEIEGKNKELIQVQEEIQTQHDFLEEKNQQISSSIKAAEDIQRAILPHEAKMQRLLKNYFIINKPRDMVSGDFIWLGESGKQTILIVADCTGHGVPGAFMTLIGANLLDKIIRIWNISNPAAILDRLHKEINTVMKQDEGEVISGMDAIVLSYYRYESKIHLNYAGAKNSLYYYDPKGKGGRLHEVKATRKSVGGEQNEIKCFENHQFSLSPGAILYLGSDGLQDQNNKKRRRFGKTKLRGLLSEVAQRPLAEQKQVIEQALDTHMEGTYQRDDILWLGVKL